MTPDRCPICDAALSFTDEDEVLRCHNRHAVPDALMAALERLKPSLRELAQVIAGLVLAGMGSPEDERTDGFVDARVIADATGHHEDTIGRWARKGRIRSHQRDGGRARRYVLAEVIADLYGGGDAKD
jgi:hypothetical protein